MEWHMVLSVSLATVELPSFTCLLTDHLLLSVFFSYS